MFRKSCFASFANTSFATFRKYFFCSCTFVSQVSQGFASTSFASLRFRNFQFRKNSQVGFSLHKFRKVIAIGTGQFADVSLLLLQNLGPHNQRMIPGRVYHLRLRLGCRLSGTCRAAAAGAPGQPTRAGRTRTSQFNLNACAKAAITTELGLHRDRRRPLSRPCRVMVQS